MERVRNVYVTTVGKLLGASGCEAEGHDHAWTVEMRGDREVWVCIHCGDEDWVYTDAERDAMASRFPHLLG